MKRSPILGIFLLILITACAPAQNPVEGPSRAMDPYTSFKEPTFEVPQPSLPESRVFATNSNVSCEAPGGLCNPAVAMLTYAKKNGAGICTATLVGEDLAVTNSHCIPEDLKEAGAQCEGRIWFHFPAYPGRPEYDSRLECSGVVEVSELKEGKRLPDVAFLRLSKKSNRPFLRMSREGFSEGEKVKITKVDPLELPSVGDGLASSQQAAMSQFKGKMYSVECNALQSSQFVSQARNRFSTIMAFVNCDIIHGNSGSVIEGQNGAAKGVIQSYLASDVLTEEAKKKSLALIDGKVQKTNLGTSFACLQGVPGLAETAVDCKKVDSSAFKAEERSANSLQVSRALFQEALKSIETHEISKLPFGWRAKSIDSEEGLELDYIPHCVKEGELGSQNSFEFAPTIPRMKAIPGLDRFARLKYQVEPKDAFESRIHLERLNNGNFSVKIMYGESLDGSIAPDEFYYKVPSC